MATCKFPYIVKNPSKLAGSFHSDNTIPVPCGKCYDCKMVLVSQWAFRIQQEEKYAISSKFVTLTYEIPPLSKNKFMTLDKTHLQKFFKRLRKAHGKEYTGKIKYFAVGEYGTKYKRPHYHVILLNACEQHIENAWSLGHVHIGNVTHSSIAYTLKYVMKDSKIPQHKNDDRLKEFRLMSKKLGIQFLDENTINQYNNAEKSYITMEENYKIPLPRYYKLKIFSPEKILKINLEIKKIHARIEEEKERKFQKTKTNSSNYVEYERENSEYKRKRSESRNKREID